MRPPPHFTPGPQEVAILAGLVDAYKLLVAARTPQPRRGSMHCAILAVDIVGFNRPGRDNEVQIALRRALYHLLAEAFDATPIPWHECVHEDRGDGAVITIPAEFPAALVTGPLLNHLRAGVRRYNRLSSEIAQIQLRVAVHAGEIHHDEHGLVGQAVTHVFRLLEAPAFKEMVARDSSETAVIVSDALYDAVVRHTTGPHTYQQVIVALKETRTSAWMRGEVHPYEAEMIS